MERSRNVDVGIRIGRDPRKDAAKPSTLEEQERLLKARRDGDETLAKAKAKLGDCKQMREFDRVPCLPGVWTLELHEVVVAGLNEVDILCIDAQELLKRGNASDRLPDLKQVVEESIEVRRVMMLAKQGEESVIATLDRVRKGAELGWPWGKEWLDESVVLVKQARDFFSQAGMTGSDVDGRMQFKENMLRRVELAVTSTQREVLKRRVPVQKLLDKFKSSIELHRFEAVKELGNIGRIPVPMTINYAGQCKPLVDEASWGERVESLGDPDVVEAVCKGLEDAEQKVRVEAVFSLVKVLSRDDARSLEELKKRSSDPNIYVKRAVIKTLRTFLSNSRAGDLLCAFLGDLDPQIRLAAMEALPKGGDEDQVGAEIILGKVLSYLEHRRRPEAYPHWITEERDVLVAALSALQRIAPKGQKEVTRRVLSMLSNSHSMAISQYTGCARDALQPLVGSRDDAGQSRGPVDIRRQLEALVSEPESSNRCKCGATSEQVRMACIKVIEAVAFTAQDLHEAREALEGGEGDAASGGASSVYSKLMLHHSVLEGLCAALGDYSRDVRWLASATIGKIADKDETIVVQALATNLTHPFDYVRSLTFEMLKGVSHGHLVSPFCREMLEETVALLASSVPSTRAAAAKALQILCPQGGQRRRPHGASEDGWGDEDAMGDVVTILADLMADPRSNLRLAALDTICKLVPGAGREAARPIENLLHSEEPRIKLLAIFALEEVVGRDEEEAMMINELLALDTSVDVRVAVMHAVSAMSQRGSSRAILALVDGCSDPSDNVRREAVQGLTRLCNKGDDRGVSSALHLLADPSASVRRAAIETLAVVSEKGNESVCLAIIAFVQREPNTAIRLQGHAAVASLRQTPWSNERSVYFTGGEVAHSSAFWWSKPMGGVRVGDKFRMLGGVPLSDFAGQRTTFPANRDASIMGALSDAPLVDKAPLSSVIDVHFNIRPKTGEPVMLMRPTSGSRPGTAQSGASEMSRVLFGPALFIDTDGCYDHIFGLLNLLVAGFEPRLVTTVHGHAEAIDGAVSSRRLLATFGLPWIPVVPSNPARGDGRFDLRPGTAPLRGPASTRRVPSRFGPDYRKHLKRLPDFLSLAPLGLSLEDLLDGDGLLERVEQIKKGILRGYAGALPRKDVHALEEGLVRVEKILIELDSDARKKMDQGAGSLLPPRPPSASETSSSSGSEGWMEHVKEEVEQVGRFVETDWASVGGSQSSRAMSGLQSQASRPATLGRASSRPSSSVPSAAVSNSWMLRTGIDSAVSALLGGLADVEDGSAMLLCLGNLTTIAGALKEDAELMRNKVRGMVIMGGSLYGAPSASQDSAYHTQGGAEFNFHYHPEAVHDVLRSGLDITLVGLDVANADACSAKDKEALTHTSGTSPSARLLRQMVSMFDLAPAYAAVACFYIVRPEAFTTDKRWVEVDPQTGVLSETLPGKQGAVIVRVALEMRRHIYFEYLRDVMSE